MHSRIIFRHSVVLTVFAAVLAGCSKPEQKAETPAPEKPISSNPLEVLAANVSLDQTKTGGLRSISGLGQVLFAHPNHKSSLPVPAETRAIAFSFGILDNARAATPKTDGVEFRVHSQDSNGQSQLIWFRVLDIVAIPADRGMQQTILPLDSTRVTRLVFETTPRGTLASDWSYWTNVSYLKSTDLTEFLSKNKRTDQFSVSGLRDLPGLGPVLFAHPHSEFVAPVVEGSKTVQFQFGVRKEALIATAKTDGVEFRILAEQTAGKPKLIWSRILRPIQNEKDRDTQSGTLTLQTVPTRLVFETLPAGTTQTDWAYWKNVSITP